MIVLPDKLSSGDKLRLLSGCVVTVQRVTGRANVAREFGEPSYRLRYPARRVDGWFLPAITGNKVWTREELAQEAEAYLPAPGPDQV